jgi:YD repeat-containing protein
MIWKALSRSQGRAIAVALAVTVGLGGVGEASAAMGAVRTGQPGEYAVDEHALSDATISVDLFSGNLLVTQQDLAPAVGTAWVAYEHSYNSQSPTANNGMGPRWQLGVGPAIELEITSSSVTAHGPNGYVQAFSERADGTFSAPAGSAATLTHQSNGTYVLVEPLLGTQLMFTSAGTLTDTVDAAGRAFTVAMTSAAGQTVLSSFGTASGQRINVSYNGDSRVREIDDPASVHRYYTYNAQGRLATFQGPAGTTTYGYDANGFLNSIALPDGSTASTVNLSDGRVSSLTITLAGGSAQTYTYSYTTGNTTTVTYPDTSQDSNAFDDDGELTEDPGVTAEATGVYAAAMGVSATQAQADVALQNQAAPLEDSLNNGLGDFYTGMWVDPADGRLKVAVATGAPLQFVTDQIATLGLTAQTDIIQRSATWADITAAKDTIDDDLSDLSDAGLVETSITPQNGAIHIEKTNSLSAAQEQEITAAVTASPVPVSVHQTDVTVFESGGTSANVCNSYALCQTPLRGGIHIQPNSTGSGADTSVSCSAGFMARGYDQKLYVMTAGHCLYEGASGSWYTSWPGDTTDDGTGQQVLSFGHRLIGAEHSYFFGNTQGSVDGGGGGDAGLIAVSDPSSASQRFDSMIALWAAPQIPVAKKELYHITGTSFAPGNWKTANKILCVSGAPLGLNDGQPHASFLCGILTGVGVTVPQGGYHTETGTVPVHNVNEVNWCPADYRQSGVLGGISGAPIFADHHAYGIQSGNRGGNGCIGYYQPINRAAEALHVTIQTG